MSNVGAALNTLQVRAGQLVELIEDEGTGEVEHTLDLVRAGVHALNEAYFRYAQEVWDKKQLDLEVVVE